MNFDFSDDAKTLKDQARRVLSENAGPDAARRIMNADAVYDESLWKRIVELGFTAARIPEANGGVGLSAEESCVLAETLGHYAEHGRYWGQNILSATDEVFDGICAGDYFWVRA